MTNLAARLRRMEASIPPACWRLEIDATDEADATRQLEDAIFAGQVGSGHLPHKQCLELLEG